MIDRGCSTALDAHIYRDDTYYRTIDTVVVRG